MFYDPAKGPPPPKPATQQKFKVTMAAAAQGASAAEPLAANKLNVEPAQKKKKTLSRDEADLDWDPKKKSKKNVD